MASSQSKLLQVLRTDHDRSKDYLDAMLMLLHRAQRKLFSWILLFAQEAEHVQNQNDIEQRYSNQLIQFVDYSNEFLDDAEDTIDTFCSS